jgi:hypothetical protein
MSVRKDYNWPKEYRILTWLGTAVDGAHSWADMLAEDTGMKVRIGGDTNTVNRFRWLGKLGLSQQTIGAPSETSQMVMADRKYAVRDGGPFQVRALWMQSKGNATYFTRGDSKIKTPHDIKPGTRITDMNPYVAATRVIDGLLAWAQVRHEDIDWVPVYSSDENIGAVVEGRADICFSFPISEHIHRAAKNPLGLSCVECNAEADPEGAKRFREWDPLVNFGIIPKESLECVGGKWGNQGLNLELTNAREDPEQVYHIAKWLDENHARYTANHKENRFRTREWLMQALAETFIPVHEGLIMYLKDLNLWTPKHEKRNRKNLDTLTRYVNDYQKLIWAADDAGLEVRPENDKWVAMWENYRDKVLPPLKLWANLDEE